MSPLRLIRAFKNIRTSLTYLYRYNIILSKDVNSLLLRDWVATALNVWSNIVTTIALIITVREYRRGKKKTASKSTRRKHKR